MNSPPVEVPKRPITARWTWKRLGRWLLVIVIAVGVAHWWLFVRLSSLEQQLVGTWKGNRDAGNGRSVQLHCELRADRTAVAEFVSIPAQPIQSATQRIRLKQPTWAASDSHLEFHEPLSPWTRLQLQCFRIQAWFRTGTAGRFRQIDGLGPIRDVRSNSVDMGEWHMERMNIRTGPD